MVKFCHFGIGKFCTKNFLFFFLKHVDKDKEVWYNRSIKRLGDSNMNRVIKATKLTKSEVEAINARIFFNNLKTDTLCWSCMNARDNKEHSCSKFKTGVPVEGSKYETHQGALG